MRKMNEDRPRIAPLRLRKSWNDKKDVSNLLKLPARTPEERSV